MTAKVEHSAPGKDIVVFKFDVQKPWHIYANPVGNEDFESNKTSIKVVAKVPPKVSIDYPAGKEYVLMGEKLKIYEGSFDIRATVEREAGATGAMEAVVRISACDDLCAVSPRRDQDPATMTRLPELARDPRHGGQKIDRRRSFQPGWNW